jgi:hypothetical protein
VAHGLENHAWTIEERLLNVAAMQQSGKFKLGHNPHRRQAARHARSAFSNNAVSLLND